MLGLHPFTLDLQLTRSPYCCLFVDLLQLEGGFSVARSKTKPHTHTSGNSSTISTYRHVEARWPATAADKTLQLISQSSVLFSGLAPCFCRSSEVALLSSKSTTCGLVCRWQRELYIRRNLKLPARNHAMHHTFRLYRYWHSVSLTPFAFVQIDV